MTRRRLSRLRRKYNAFRRRHHIGPRFNIQLDRAQETWRWSYADLGCPDFRLRTLHRIVTA